MLVTYTFLIIAIILEVIATNALKSSDQFTKIEPSLLSLSCYCISLYLISLVLQRMSLGITYAIWSGVGIVLMALIAVLYHKETIDFATMLGIVFIITGVVIINLFSNLVN